MKTNSFKCLGLGFFVSLFLFFGTFSTALFAEEERTPDTTFLPIEKIYSIERGFDTTDVIEVAVKGFLPNSCHSLGKGTYSVDQISKKIFVNVEGYVRSNDICLQVKTPYLEVIQLGLLKEGTYEVLSLSSPGAIGKLHVEKSKSERRDEFLYAPVDTVELIDDHRHLTHDDSQNLTIKGRYPYLLKGCMRVVDVKTYKTKNDVLVVLPISEILHGDSCLTGVNEYNRFDIKKRVHSIIEGKGLVHVRTLDGKPLNKLVDFTKE